MEQRWRRQAGWSGVSMDWSGAANGGEERRRRRKKEEERRRRRLAFKALKFVTDWNEEREGSESLESPDHAKVTGKSKRAPTRGPRRSCHDRNSHNQTVSFVALNETETRQEEDRGQVAGEQGLEVG
ncbi:hypothetical protein JCGZ_08940 [Jatropha curcas]|uniref:Uncharacterized protein n=1 Tax=Jatropha curcas TaxID=180498 RepID=A0A067KHA0_JATCU|nr:hypothetical protein JCGZ_08940 [Jatropha curcas]